MDCWEASLTRACATREQAMNGTMSLGEALERRLQIINCTPQDIQNFIRDNPPETRLVKVLSVGHWAPLRL
jgi:hypothetical protein